MGDYLDEIFAFDSDGYEEYFSKIDGNRRSKYDKKQEEVTADYAEYE